MLYSDLANLISLERLRFVLSHPSASRKRVLWRNRNRTSKRKNDYSGENKNRTVLRLTSHNVALQKIAIVTHFTGINKEKSGNSIVEE